MRILGTHQTTYADWARAVISHYPVALTNQLDTETDTVHVFAGETEVAYYDFAHGTAFIEDCPIHDITEMGKWESLTEIDVDSLVKK